MPTNDGLFLDHDDPDSQHWFIHGKRYDLRPFLDQHPAGRRPLELTQGRECTELFESYHSLCKRPRAMLGRFEVTDEPRGCPHSASPFVWDETPFYDDLKTRVRAYFADQPRHAHKMPRIGWALLWLWSALAVASFVGWLLGQWWSLLALPLFYWLGASNLMHTGGHFALSRRPWLNQLGSLLGSVHIAPLTWQLQHNIGHHAFTNIPGRDPDLNHFQHLSDPMPGFRLSPKQPWRRKYLRHRWAMASQSMMTTMGPSLLNTPEYLIDGKVAKVVPFLFRSRTALAVHVLGRLAIVGVCFVLPFFLFAPGKAFAFALVPLSVHGLLYFAFSQVSHANEGCVADLDTPREWAEHQVRTCHDYRTRSRFWSSFSIGLNNQAVHHLFPQVAPWHYPALAGIVADTGAAHGIPYGTSPSWSSAFAKLVRHVARLNDGPGAAGDSQERSDA
jgi:fatty acid desaturase